MEIDFNRIAVKVGSNVLTRRDGTLDVTRMSALVDQIAELHKAGIEIILVSSGAVASGRSEVRPTKKLDSVDQRQLFSAVGHQPLLRAVPGAWHPRGTSAHNERELFHPPPLPQPEKLYDRNAGERRHSYCQ